MKRRTDNGFSLVEVLVALAVLAVSASVLLASAETHTRSVNGLSDRLLARWIAQNHLVGLSLGHPSEPVVLSMGGMEWRVISDLSATLDPDLVRADITVTPVSSPTAILARLTGFLDRPEVGT